MSYFEAGPVFPLPPGAVHVIVMESYADVKTVRSVMLGRILINLVFSC